MNTENEFFEMENLSIDLAVLDRLAKWFRSMGFSNDLFADCLEFIANGNSAKTLRNLPSE